MVIHNMHRVIKNLSHPTCVFLAEVKQGNVLLSCFSSQTINKCPFHGLFIATFIAFLCCCFVILLIIMTPNLGLSSVPKYKKAVTR